MESWFKSVVDLGRRLGWRGAVGLSLVLAIASIALALVIVIGWPVDQFKGETSPPFWERRHPAVRMLGLGFKNVAGVVIVLLGIVMALPGVPGQGLLLILIGLTLVNFPGKRRLERKLIRRPAISRVVNMMRRRFGRPALEID